jgi:hypothetical protein
LRGEYYLLRRGLHFFVCFYGSEDKTKRLLAALALACAAVLKVHPVLFGLLYLPQKRYKDAFLSAIFTLILGFGPFFFLKGHFFDNLSTCLEGMGAFSDCWSNTFSTDSLIHPLERIFSYSLSSEEIIRLIFLGGLRFHHPPNDIHQGYCWRSAHPSGDG